MASTDNAAGPGEADDRRWRAVADNNAAMDGDFVYAVRTTGIYCRPSCPSRRPRRANVVFHNSAAEAEQAGYRPCKRCLPDKPSYNTRASALVTRACRIIDESRDAAPSLSKLAHRVGASPHHLHRLFRRITGLTPRQYAAAMRERRLRAALGRGDSVTAAMLDAGYQSTGHLHASAGSALGMTPSQYRDGGTDSLIRFAVGQSTLGAILVAGTERGICMIALNDDPEALLRALQARFPNAKLIGDDHDFEQHVARVVGFVEAPALGLELPLDIRGTAFQQRVWRALCEIPPGHTASYAEIAERLGQPTAARAVARACASNNLALAIPCHRVVRRDGGLSGYRWGLAVKRTLLERESRSAAGD